MTILAATDAHLVEFEAGILTIARYSDGHCVALNGKGIAGQFRACLSTHTAERVTATFLRICNGQAWRPLYKPDRMPRGEQLAAWHALPAAHLHTSRGVRP